MAVKLPSPYLSLPRTQTDSWVRPSDWPVITNNANEINALVNDTGEGYISFTAVFTGSAFVDWGDGSAAQSITSGVAFRKYYTKGTGTPCSRGYTTFVVRVYGGTFTSFRPTYAIPVNSNGTTIGARYSIGLLELHYGDNVGIGNGGSYFSSSGAPNSLYSYLQLEYVKFPQSNTSATNFNYMFQNCSSLGKVLLPNCSSTVNFTNAFTNCFNLREIVFPSNLVASSMDLTFQGCTALKSVTFNNSDWTACTSWSTTFSGCMNLVTIEMPRVLSTQFASLFQDCYNLRYARFPKNSLDYSASATQSVSFSSAFSNCSSLQQVILPEPRNTTVTGPFMFQNCSDLNDIVVPDGFIFNSCNSLFSGCRSLQRVNFVCATFSTTTSGMPLSSAFLNCFSLVDVKLPTASLITPANTNNPLIIANTFQNCYSLGTFSTTLDIRNAPTCFSGCKNLKSVSLPNATSLAVMNSMFAGCSNLTNISLPATLVDGVRFDFMFDGCSSLETINFPNLPSTAAQTSVSPFNGTFQSCANLRSVTFGTTGLRTYSTAAGAWSAMFLGCTKLRSVNLSNLSNLTITTSSDNAGSMFSGCSGLESIKYGIILASANALNYNLSGQILNCQSLTDYDATGVLSTNTGLATWTNTAASANVGNLRSATFSCRFSRFQNQGAVGATFSLSKLRLLNNTTGQYTGTSPQIDVSYTLLDRTNLVQLFNDLPTVTGRTINITNCPGAASLTAGERAIATGKGWTITG